MKLRTTSLRNRFSVQKFLVDLTFVIVVLITVSICQAKESAALPYPVYDSGVWADAIHDPQIHWLDDYRVIFKNSLETEKAKHYQGKFNLAVWQLGKGVTPRTDAAKFVTSCVHDGYVHYALGDGPKHMRHFAGMFGQEKPLDVSTDGSVLYNEISCRFVADKKLVALNKERKIRLLLERDGYLDIGPMKEYSFSNEPVMLRRPGSPEAIKVSVPAKHASIIHYYPFKNAYVVHDIASTTRFWWLHSDGKVEQGSLPNESYPFPTRKGVVIGWGKAKSDRDPGTVGLYLWDGKERIKLISGYVAGQVVSPDGCKLAFAHYPYLIATSIRDSGRVTLKMINLCMEENNNG